MAGKSSSLRQPRRGREVVPALRAPLVRDPVPAVALHPAPRGAPAARPKPTTVRAPAPAPPPAAPPPRPPNQRSPPSDRPRRASRPLRPPLCRLREPRSPARAPVHAPAPALVPLPPTASAKSRARVQAGGPKERLVSAEESARTSRHTGVPPSESRGESSSSSKDRFSFHPFWTVLKNFTFKHGRIERQEQKFYSHDETLPSALGICNLIPSCRSRRQVSVNSRVKFSNVYTLYAEAFGNPRERSLYFTTKHLVSGRIFDTLFYIFFLSSPPFSCIFRLGVPATAGVCDVKTWNACMCFRLIDI